jgi:hypothetical protein
MHHLIYVYIYIYIYIKIDGDEAAGEGLKR